MKAEAAKRAAIAKNTAGAAKATRTEGRPSKPPPPPKADPVIARRRWWYWFRGWKGWVAGLSTLLGILAFCETVWGPLEARTPEFHVQEVSVDDPFGVYFSLDNPSKLFSRTLISVRCYVNKVVTGSVSYRDSYIEAPIYVKILEPAASLSYSCPFASLQLSARDLLGQGNTKIPPILEAQVKLIVNYLDVFSNPQCIESDMFSFNARTRSWVKGQVLNARPFPGSSVFGTCQRVDQRSIKTSAAP